ncbi:hypothetical protein BpHYR1_047237 [Brachionus plicatilis]
MLVFM